LADRRNQKTGADQSLPFEKRILELEEELANAQDETARKRVEEELERERQSVFSNLTPWQRVQMARHPQRPRMLDYVRRVLQDFMELHGDRAIGDDPAMVGGIGRFQGQSVVVVGQQKGVTTEEKVSRNFGMAHPEGYRKAMRLFEMAERLKLPVITFVDTPAAHPGIEAEQHGQGPAIARNLWLLSRLRTPVYCVVLAEGGSGGALGIAVGDWIAMFEHAIYVICPPERCAEILWRDAERKELAASVMRVTAEDLRRLGVIDEVLEEPMGGAHRDVSTAAGVLGRSIDQFLQKVRRGEWSPEDRSAKFMRMGQYLEAVTQPSGDPGETE
jgi:acetyl-CoA carboxylase carboxyl transferase subunit alpha